MSVWLVRAGRHGEQEETALTNNLVCYGWDELSDLAALTTKESILERLREVLPDASEAKLRNHVGQLYAFTHRIHTGDLVVLPLKTRAQIAVGKIAGPYRYRTDLGPGAFHTRPVEWLRTDLARTAFDQDLLYSFGAFMTVCQIQREHAEARIRAVVEGRPSVSTPEPIAEDVAEASAPRDMEQVARDQIIDHIQRKFTGHGLARLVNEVLAADGNLTLLSPAGRDSGVDVLAAGGTLGFAGSKLCVQVKSSTSSTDAPTLRALKGSMRDFQADHGLLVSWGGFTRAAEEEARKSFFSVRLWDAHALVEALFRCYDRLPKDLQSELPLKQIWALVVEE